MSADRWQYCPRCKQKAEDAKNAQKLKAGKSYGKVTSEKYLEMLAEAEKPVETEETFREDFFVGIIEDEFEVDYCGSCNVCGLEKKFKHKEGIESD